MLRVVLRDFEYNMEELANRNTNKKTAVLESQNDKEALFKCCKDSFKDIYSTYIHIKVTYLSLLPPH